MEDVLKTINITKTQLKVFLGTFAAIFIMTSLQYLGVHFSIFKFVKMPQIISPLPKQGDVLDTLRPKLEQNPPKFELKKEPGLIAQTYAATDTDTAAAYALVDLDNGQIITEKNGTKRLPIASLTKIMTAMVALDLAKPTDMFTVTPQAANMIPTKIVITPGEKLTLDELLNASLITSANDATEQIRDGVDEKYHDTVFVRAMNDKASFLNLADTHFATPQGFDSPDNYSTAEDLAKMTQYALTNYPFISNVVQKDFAMLPESQYHKRFRFYNWNGLLDVYPGAQGVKIGNTAAAGTTTIVEATRGGKKLLAVVLGTHGVLERDLTAAKLLDTGFTTTLGLAPVNVTEEQLREKYGTWQYSN